MVIKIIKLFLKKLNHITVGDYRAENLSEIIVKLILKYSDKNRSIKIMDYGSGFQPKVIYYVYKKLKLHNMFDNKSYIKIKINSERSFGLIFAAVFLIISLYPLRYGEDIRIWALLIVIILLFVGILFPKLLVVPNKLWFKLGLILGAIVAPIIMAIVFFITVTPIGIILRLFNKDILSQKIKKSAESYWIKRKETKSSMKNQF